MSASPPDPKSSSSNRENESPFEATEHSLAGENRGHETTNGHHHPGPSAPLSAEAAQGTPEPFGSHRNRGKTTAAPANAVPDEQARAAASGTSNLRPRLWTVAALIVGLLGLFVLFRELTTATSLQGSTVGNLIQLRAVLAGTVDEVTTREGDDVIVGQTVARLGASGADARLHRIEDVLTLKRLEADQVEQAIEEERQRLRLLHEISQLSETTLQLGIDERKIRLDLATRLATELQGSVNRGSAKKLEYLQAENNRLRIAKQLEESQAALELQRLITTNAAQGRHYHDGVVRSRLDELQLHSTKVATEIGQTEVEAATLRATVHQSAVTAHRDGRVVAVHRSAGSPVQPGDTLVTLETDDRVWIIASFSYAEAEDIAYGDRAEIDLPALGRSVSGTVAAIGHNVISAIDADSPFLRMTPEEVLVKIEPDETIDEVRSGISAKVRIHTHSFDPFGWISKKFADLGSAREDPAAGTDASREKPAQGDPRDERIAPIAPEPVPADRAAPPAPKKAPPEAVEEAIPPPPPGEEIPPMNHPFDFSTR